METRGKHGPITPPIGLKTLKLKEQNKGFADMLGKKTLFPVNVTSQTCPTIIRISKQKERY